MWWKMFRSVGFTNRLSFMHFLFNGSSTVKVGKWLKAEAGRNLPSYDHGKRVDYKRGFHVYTSPKTLLSMRGCIRAVEYKNVTCVGVQDNIGVAVCNNIRVLPVREAKKLGCHVE